MFQVCSLMIINLK